MLTDCASSAPVSWVPVARKLSEKRLHLHYGPIDLLIDVDATEFEQATAHRVAQDTFNGVLENLVAELDILKTPINRMGKPPKGVIAQAMFDATCRVSSHHYSLIHNVTPMAAVAGAVADYVLQALISAVPKAKKIWVNNGGDIAVHLAPGETSRVAISRNSGESSATVQIKHHQGVGGIATSGWAGRSHSFGVADAVTVLAATAAFADVAATVIANEVRLPTPLDELYVEREAANELQPDSDLQDKAVTVNVLSLSTEHQEMAVINGLAVAKKLINIDPIVAVYIECQGHKRSIGECV